MEANYGVCSKPGCDVIKSVSWHVVYRAEARYCPKCGSALIFRCPHCHQEIHHKDGVFCFHCSRPFKPVVKLRRRPATHRAVTRRGRASPDGA